MVDEDKWHDLNLFNWIIDNNYYVQTNIKRKPVRIHNYIYNKYKQNENINDKVIDHINGKDKIYKRLDNRLINLRISTRAENSYNRQTKNKNGYRGVISDKNNKYYRAQITCNNKRYTTKAYNTIEEAALAYNELAKQYYGDRAMLNTIIKFEDN